MHTLITARQRMLALPGCLFHLNPFRKRPSTPSGQSVLFAVGLPQQRSFLEHSTQSQIQRGKEPLEKIEKLWGEDSQAFEKDEKIFLITRRDWTKFAAA